jgi:predicted nucleotidyltransferase
MNVTDVKSENFMETLEDTCRKHNIVDLYVFGSRSREIAERVRGEAIQSAPSTSDVDIGVLPREVSQFGPLERVSLSIDLEDLFDAPRVDLIVLPEADPFLALDVIRGELLFTDDADRQARYELFVLRRAGDLMPFKKQRIRMILEERGR